MLVTTSDCWATKTSRSRVLVEIATLLNEYKEIVAQDILDGLLPVRSISHCMNLISGASFLNKVPYILTRTEKEELNGHMHEFLQKGFIR